MELMSKFKQIFLNKKSTDFKKDFKISTKIKNCRKR